MIILLLMVESIGTVISVLLICSDMIYVVGEKWYLNYRFRWATRHPQ